MRRASSFFSFALPHITVTQPIKLSTKRVTREWMSSSAKRLHSNPKGQHLGDALTFFVRRASLAREEDPCLWSIFGTVVTCFNIRKWKASDPKTAETTNWNAHDVLGRNVFGLLFSPNRDFFLENKKLSDRFSWHDVERKRNNSRLSHGWPRRLRVFLFFFFFTNHCLSCRSPFGSEGSVGVLVISLFHS